MTAATQACFDGAHGARATLALKCAPEERLQYDGNAYTITATFVQGLLRIYTSHIVESESPLRAWDCWLNLIRSWDIDDENPEICLEAVTAYRNLVDWAAEKRDELIRGVEGHRGNAMNRRKFLDDLGVGFVGKQQDLLAPRASMLGGKAQSRKRCRPDESDASTQGGQIKRVATAPKSEVQARYSLRSRTEKE